MLAKTNPELAAVLVGGSTVGGGGALANPKLLGQIAGTLGLITWANHSADAASKGLDALAAKGKDHTSSTPKSNTVAGGRTASASPDPNDPDDPNDGEKKEVEESNRIKRDKKKLSPEQRQSYEKAVKALENGTIFDEGKFNAHSVKGTDTFTAYLSEGTGPGKARLIFKILEDGSYEIVEIILDHRY